ncbi:hypothetical protein BGZ94_010221 [Podila epigama]|nr:hypothetical protein BGZ94_010221 [Podila epigama]
MGIHGSAHARLMHSPATSSISFNCLRLKQRMARSQLHQQQQCTFIRLLPQQGVNAKRRSTTGMRKLRTVSRVSPRHSRSNTNSSRIRKPASWSGGHSSGLFPNHGRTHLGSGTTASMMMARAYGNINNSIKSIKNDNCNALGMISSLDQVRCDHTFSNAHSSNNNNTTAINDSMVQGGHLHGNRLSKPTLSSPFLVSMDQHQQQHRPQHGSSYAMHPEYNLSLQGHGSEIDQESGSHTETPKLLSPSSSSSSTPSSSLSTCSSSLSSSSMLDSPETLEMIRLKREAYQELASQTQRFDELFIAKMIYWESLDLEEKSRWLDQSDTRAIESDDEDDEDEDEDEDDEDDCDFLVIEEQEQPGSPSLDHCFQEGHATSDSLMMDRTRSGSYRQGARRQSPRQDEMDDLVSALDCRATVNDYSALLAYEQQQAQLRQSQGHDSYIPH